jgi:hypothetical protein
MVFQSNQYATFGVKTYCQIENHDLSCTNEQDHVQEADLVMTMEKA